MLSNKLKQRFCKDNKLSIQLFDEPYFTHRLDLLDKLDEYFEFERMIDVRFNGNEQEYLEYYNQLKDKIIDYIKASEAYQALNSDDMNKYRCKYEIRQSDVYKGDNVGKKFISIDMTKANFSSLVHYGLINYKQFFKSFSWEEFMKQFTDIEYFAKSKYIRQVVMGNCNPKRQVTYEKFLMSMLVDQLIDSGIIELCDIYSFCSDEVVIDLSKVTNDNIEKLMVEIDKFNSRVVPLHTEKFRLLKVGGTDAYIKQFKDNSLKLDDVKVKCVTPYELPIIYRKLKGEQVRESDLYFEFNGRIAKFIDFIEIDITGDE